MHHIVCKLPNDENLLMFPFYSAGVCALGWRAQITVGSRSSGERPNGRFQEIAEHFCICRDLQLSLSLQSFRQRSLQKEKCVRLLARSAPLTLSVPDCWHCNQRPHGCQASTSSWLNRSRARARATQAATLRQKQDARMGTSARAVALSSCNLM